MAKRRMPKHESVGPNVKGTLSDGREFWVFRGKPWKRSSETENTYAKFQDGSVRKFAAFAQEVRIELRTENHIDERLGRMSGIYGWCRGVFVFDGIVVYGFLANSMELALILAHHHLRRFRWLELTQFQGKSPADFFASLPNRPVFYREVPGLIESYDAPNGVLNIRAAKGRTYPRLAPNLPRTSHVEVDIRR